MNAVNYDYMKMLEMITELSREFGTDDYLKAGGGNSSVKNDTTMWIKPSGTVLCQLEPDDFLPLDRAKVKALYGVTPPAEIAAREELVKNIMLGAVLSDREGRPSVEAPLHESIDYKYVMHTHPVLVNGMTCAKNGERACERIFPEALWFDKAEAGYMLCMNLRKRLEAYKNENGRQPEIIFLKNHGMFVASDKPARLRELHAQVMDALREEYDRAGVSNELLTERAVSEERVAEDTVMIKRLLEDEAEHVVSSVPFAVVPGPITPDHIVYSKSYPFTEALGHEAILAFKNKRGYSPRVIKTENGVYGVGADLKSAELALVLAIDGARVRQLARAFGGLEFMSEEASDFFDNWEVEKYRRSLIK